MTTLVATNLKALIADVPAFRTWVGAGDQTAARARVYVAGIDDADAVRPFALIMTEPGSIGRRVAGGAADIHEEDGAIWVLFENTADGDDEEAVANAFLSDVGDIVSGMAVLAGNGYLRIRTIEMSDPYQRTLSDDGQDICQIAFRVDWGTA